jgi:RMKL-like, methyltransferase domain
MPDYALLVLPSSNRVYTEASTALTRAELAVFDQSVLGGRLSDVDNASIGGVPYVTFRGDALSDRDTAFLGNLSSAYALYEVVGDLLRPVALRPLDQFDDDLVTILKYKGKTNERFTKLLLNVTLLSSAFADQMPERRFSVIDPLCGRGTTLNQALMYGFDAAGIDRDQQDFEAYATFIQTWLKRKRVKHQAVFGPVRREKRVVAKRLKITLAGTREAYRSGETQCLDVVNTDTTRCLEFFRPETQDLVVADAPYGIQHGSRTTERGLTRTPLALISEAAPIWAKLLRPGGAFGMSWNTYVAHREDLATILTDAGLDVLDEGPYLEFKHRVDQAITRDIIVARKPL